VFGPVTVAPFLMCGGTDAYKYENFSDCVFRFCPFHLTPEERHTIHSHNESVRAEALGTAAVFYEDLLYRVAGHYEETVE
jgi:acetylornithine deacetylase/succinyl-diaminopimelate desuccinylase-like protein